jgi:hypothetical protein
VYEQLPGCPVFEKVSISIAAEASADGKEADCYRHQADSQQADRGGDAQKTDFRADRPGGDGVVSGY